MITEYKHTHIPLTGKTHIAFGFGTLLVIKIYEHIGVYVGVFPSVYSDSTLSHY